MWRCSPGHDFKADKVQAAVGPAGQLLVGGGGLAGVLEMMRQ